MKCEYHKKGSDNSLKTGRNLVFIETMPKLASCGELEISDYSAKSISTLLTGAFIRTDKRHI